MSPFRAKSLVILALFVFGCGGGKVTPTTSSGSADTTTSSPAGASSDDVLTSALFQLRPENFGINSTTDKPVSLLNSWRFKQLEQRGGNDQPMPAKIPAGWTTSDDQTWIEKPKYDYADAVHIRDAMFFHTIAAYLSDRGHDELQRAAIVVDFVCRNVALWRDNEVEIPLQPFLNMQLGRGSTKDRAWVCSEILRQLRMDAVIVRANSDAKASSEKWLLGVIVDRQLYLFDLRLGLPIFGGAQEKGLSVATLATIVDHPEWLEQMSAQGAYRIAADSLKEPTIFMVTRPNFWCPRMGPLEQVLPAKDACVLYDPVLGEGTQKGLKERLVDVGNWSGDSLKLWAYPRLQLEAARQPSEEANQELKQLLEPLGVPIRVLKDKEGKPTGTAADGKLQRYRADHLLGKFTEATQRYLSIRHLEVEPNSPDIARLNRAAAEDAFYWTILCKFELGEYETAVEQGDAYVKKYHHNGKWFFPARTVLAQSYVEMGQLSEAIATLKKSSTDDPNYEGNMIRVKRWEAGESK